MQLTHLHLPKTAGTSLRESIALAHPDLNIHQVVDPARDTAPATADVFSGHFSFDDTRRYGHPVVTVLRHPVDRFVSIYFFWRQLFAKDIERTRKTSIAHHLPLLDFAKAMDEPELTSELYNRMAWQLHSDFRLARRFETRRQTGLTTRGLVDGVMDNLRGFAVVGFQDRYPDFLEALNARFGMAIENRKVNVTERRSALEDLTRAELSAILTWVEADMEIYHAALKEFG